MIGMQKSPTAGSAISRHTRVLSSGDLLCLGSGYRPMSRSARTAAVHRRPQRHARPPGITPATHLIQTVQSNSALQNQARKQGNQTEIKPSQTEKFHHWSACCDSRSCTLTSLARVKSLQPIQAYSNLIQPFWLPPPRGAIFL